MCHIWIGTWRSGCNHSASAVGDELPTEAEGFGAKLESWTCLEEAFSVNSTRGAWDAERVVDTYLSEVLSLHPSSACTTHRRLRQTINRAASREAELVAHRQMLVIPEECHIIRSYEEQSRRRARTRHEPEQGSVTRSASSERRRDRHISYVLEEGQTSHASASDNGRRAST